MLSIWMMAALASNQAAAEPTVPAKPAIKTCPDGAVILASDRCPVLPDHRYQWTYAARDMTLTTAWTCGDRQPVSEAIIRVTDKGVNEQGEPVRGSAFAIELVSLRVSGRAAPVELLAKVRAALKPFNSIGYLHGRCLAIQSGGTESVLSFQGFGLNKRDSRHVEVSLR